MAWIGGSILTGRLKGTLTAEPADLAVLAVVLVSEPTSTDCALYTLDQYTSLTTAKTRVRLQVERLADGSVRAYGFYTGKKKEWENVPVIAATAEGERFFVELGQGVKLTWTPAAATPMPKLNDSPPLPPVWVYPPTDMAGNILGKPVLPPEYQDMVIWFPNSEIPPFYLSFCIAQTCPHPDMMEELAAYIAGEMNRNIRDPAVLKMKELNSYDTAAETKKFLELPWYATAGATSPQTTGYANAAAALALWTERVGQDRPWDHKPKLRLMYSGDVWHKQGKYIYFYDIWSNIHYGYVGMAGGLSESVLLDGAGAEQIVSDGLRKTYELLTESKEARTLPGPHPTANPWTDLRSWDDVADRVSISIGVKLYKQHPNGGVTAKMIMDEVLAVEPDSWGDGIEDHICS
ncbi:polymorphic toxin type 44 domain-containing protein [Pseudomonas sp. GB2N2]